MFIANPFVSFPAAPAPPAGPTSTGVDLTTIFGAGDLIARFTTDQATVYDLSVTEPGSNTAALTAAAIETAMENDGSFALDDSGITLVGDTDTDLDVNGSGTLASASLAYAVNVGTLHYYTGSVYELVTKIEHGYGSFTQSGTDADFS